MASRTPPRRAPARAASKAPTAGTAAAAAELAGSHDAPTLAVSPVLLATALAAPPAPTRKAAKGRKDAKPKAKDATGKPAKAAAPEKAEKPKKPKMVRDSFTMPKPEYAVLDILKERALKAGAPAKKSELLRAAIQVLSALPDAAFLAALQALPIIKTGRPPRQD